MCVVVDFILCVCIENLLELHRGQGWDIVWRDSLTCPSEEEYRTMVTRSTFSITSVCLYMCGVWYVWRMVCVVYVYVCLVDLLKSYCVTNCLLQFVSLGTL